MLQIVEIITRTVQGMTAPMICRADDDRLYVVKGRDALNRGLISEYVCARLGQAFGLPIPDFTVIEMPEELCQYDSDLLRRFCGAPCFASRHLPNLLEFDRQCLTERNSALLQDIFLFDYWIRNDDRHFTSEHGGNPNLLVDPSQQQVYVIDHNLAFANDFDLPAFLATHVGRHAWFARQTDMLRMETYKTRMRQALADCGSLRDPLPTEWLGNDNPAQDDFSAIIKAQLVAFEADDFWVSLQ